MVARKRVRVSGHLRRVKGIARSRSRRRRMRGSGFWGDAWEGAKNLGRKAWGEVKDAGRAIYDKARRDKVLSKLVKDAGYDEGAKYVEKLGFGRRRRRRLRGHGMSGGFIPTPSIM